MQKTKLCSETMLPNMNACRKNSTNSTNWKNKSDTTAIQLPQHIHTLRRPVHTTTSQPRQHPHTRRRTTAKSRTRLLRQAIHLRRNTTRTMARRKLPPHSQVDDPQPRKRTSPHRHMRTRQDNNRKIHTPTTHQRHHPAHRQHLHSKRPTGTTRRNHAVPPHLHRRHRNRKHHQHLRQQETATRRTRRPRRTDRQTAHPHHQPKQKQTPCLRSCLCCALHSTRTKTAMHP